MVQFLFPTVVILYIAVLVSIPQVKIRISVRFYIVSHLPAVVEESTLRVEGKTSHFDRLFVHRKVSFIQLPSGAQTLRDRWVSPRSCVSALVHFYLVRKRAMKQTDCIDDNSYLLNSLALLQESQKMLCFIITCVVTSSETALTFLMLPLLFPNLTCVQYTV